MRLYFFLTLLLFSIFAKGQKMVFDMSAFGIHFGKLTVSKTQENDSTELYTLRAKGYLKVLWMERDDETIQEVRYRNGVLVSSSYKQIETKQVKRWTNISFDGTKYQVDSYRGKRSFNTTAAFSILKLYFTKPTNLKQIFYEPECEFASIKYTDNNTVEIKTPEGNRNVYHFINGILNEMEFHISIATVSCTRIN